MSNSISDKTLVELSGRSYRKVSRYRSEYWRLQ